MFRNLVCLCKADLTLCHLLKRMALKIQCVGQRWRSNCCSGHSNFTRLKQHRQIAVDGIQPLLLLRRPCCLTAGTAAKPGHAGAGAVGSVPMLPTEIPAAPAENPVEPAGEMPAVVEIGGVTGPPAWRAMHPPDLFAGTKKKSTILPTKYSAFLVENSGIEPLTSCMPCKRSPS